MDPEALCSVSPIGCAIGEGVGVIGDAVNGVGDAVNAATGFADFWSDPAGNSFNMLQDGAKSLAGSVLPAITKATLPDLTADWFIQAYAISFGLAIFVFVALLIPQFVRTARGQQSGEDLAQSLTLYAPAFLIGAAFGPAMGSILVTFFGSLSDSLIGWSLNSSTQTIVDKFSGMLSETDNGIGIAGGAVLGVILMLCMIIGLLVVVLILIVQLITLYFSGVLFPLGLVWIVDPTKRQFGLKIAYLWFGILASHPLLFFMLGIAYNMIASSTDALDEPTLQRTVTLIVSILSLLIAGLSPLLLAKFAPVIPMGGNGAGVSAGGIIGSQTMQQADARQSSGGGSGGGGSSNDGGSESSGGTRTSTGGGSTNTSGGGESEEQASSSISDATKGTTSTAGATSTAGVGAAAGTTAGAGEAAGGLAAAGAAESSTGAGAAIGVPTLIAAGAMAAGSAAQKATDAVGEAAASPVDDFEEHYGKDSVHE